MKKSFVVCSLILLLAFAAVAHDVPPVETFLGYTHTRCNSATNVLVFSSNDANSQFAHNFNRWLSGAADLGGVYYTASPGIDAESIIPSQSIYIPGAGSVSPNQPVGARLTDSQTAFAITAGGGHVTRLQSLQTVGDNRLHKLPYTTGFNFTFGGPR